MKTFKRELAALLLVWLVYIVEVKDVSIVEVLVWPIFSFAGAAFGFDAYSKLQRYTSKSSNWGRSERSGKYPTREDEYPNDRYYQDSRAEDK